MLSLHAARIRSSLDMQHWQTPPTDKEHVQLEVQMVWVGMSYNEQTEWIWSSGGQSFNWHWLSWAFEMDLPRILKSSQACRVDTSTTEISQTALRLHRFLNLLVREVSKQKRFFCRCAANARHDTCRCLPQLQTAAKYQRCDSKRPRQEPSLSRVRDCRARCDKTLIAALLE